MQKPSVVWVVHPVKDDIRAALRFGNIRYIGDRYVYPDELGEDGQMPGDTVCPIYAAASNFDPELDYLLLVGDQVQVAAMSAVLFKLKSRFRVLRYDRQAAGYVPVLIA